MQTKGTARRATASNDVGRCSVAARACALVAAAALLGGGSAALAATAAKAPAALPKRVGTTHKSVTRAAGSFTTNDLSGTGSPLTPYNLAESLVGIGVTISNVSFTGVATAAGTFAGGTGIISFPSGVILSSGNIANVSGPNVADDISADNGLGGDADLDALIGSYATYDATVLEFDFVPNASTVYFEYVFASDEYNEWINTGFDDVFGFFVNGQNCAVVGNPAVPVSIDTINDGNPYGGGGPNSNLYLNNDLQDGGGSINTEMDGVTQTLVCQASVNPNVPNHIKLAIADASDHVWDSNVFIRGGSFSTTPPELCNDGSDDDGDGLIDCTDPDCSSSPYCVSPTCGNGSLDPGEECDDGNTQNGDGCRADCTLETCGDGVLDPGEECDPAIPGAGDDCDDSCQLGTCGDGVLGPDEDCDDGNTQSGDGCSSSCQVEEPESDCSNGVDDDSDGLVDCADPDCAGDHDCTPVPEVCDNGLDDDLDGAIDCADSDCASDPICAPPTEVCDNGLDDDFDGATDCADSDCVADPLCAPPPEVCDNGADDDFDGLIDCVDSDCAADPACAPPTEVCDNGLDDDLDGAADCADTECAAFPACTCSDADGDGYGNPASAYCDHPELDCNDAIADTNPGHVEVPGNGLDDDCNPATSDCKDQDGDGYGNPASAACAHPELDCNDTNANVNPGKTELPGNGLDDDCNAATPGACTPKLAEAGVASAPSGTGTVDLGLYLVPGAALALVLRGLRRRIRRS